MEATQHVVVNMVAFGLSNWTQMMFANMLLLTQARRAATTHDHALRVLLHLILIINSREIISNRVALRSIVTWIIVFQFLLFMII